MIYAGTPWHHKKGKISFQLYYSSIVVYKDTGKKYYFKALIKPQYVSVDGLLKGQNNIKPSNRLIQRRACFRENFTILTS